VLLHDGQEPDNDLAARPDEDLTLSGSLCIADVVEAVAEDGYADHAIDSSETISIRPTTIVERTLTCTRWNLFAGRNAEKEVEPGISNQKLRFSFPSSQ
jgi:hypothetical protein